MPHMQRPVPFAALALAVVTVSTGVAAQTPPAPPPALAPAPAPASAPAGYALGIGDAIDVAVADSPTFKVRTTIEGDGTVVLPLIGRITAAGSSLTAFRDAVRARLVSGGFFVRPEVSVTLVTATSQSVTVLGEVGSPSTIALDREYRLSAAIARVGGVRSAGVDKVTLTRADGTTQTYSIRALATSTGAADPVLANGDKVFVAPAEIFYIYGEVGSPGTYPIDEGMTVQQALAKGGGLTQLGSTGKVKLTREGRERKVSMGERLQPGDTLVIGKRFF